MDFTIGTTNDWHTSRMLWACRFNLIDLKWKVGMRKASYIVQLFWAKLVGTIPTPSNKAYNYEMSNART